MLTGANVDARYTSLPISAAMISIVMCICGIEWILVRELEGETKKQKQCLLILLSGLWKWFDLDCCGGPRLQLLVLAFLQGNNLSVRT